MKNKRQEKILELITKFSIDTQEMLIEKLSECGVTATQTTVSRDIRELKIIKGMGPDGGYRYILPNFKHTAASPVLNSVLTDSVLKIENAQNIVVIKTYAGMANAVAVCIDSLEKNHIIGSVAGDDTVLIVVKNNETAEFLKQDLKSVFKV